MEMILGGDKDDAPVVWKEIFRLVSEAPGAIFIL